MMAQPAANPQSFTEDEVGLLIQNGQFKELFRDLRIDPNHVFVNSGNTILHLSVKYGTAILTNTVISLGCNVNIQNTIGNTALMDAVIQKRLLQVKLLLKATSDIHATNVEGDSTLKLSLKSLDDLTELAIMKLLFEKVKRTTADSEMIFKMVTEANCSLTCAVFLNDVRVIKLMLQRNYDINDRSFYNGWTALHVAAMESNREMVKLLVEHGCDINIPDVFGYLPLNYAFDYSMVQCPKIIKALMPTNVNWTDLCYPCGTMKLRFIFAMGSKETLQLFLQSYQIDFFAKDKKGMTSLHYLASNSNDGIFDLYQNFDFDVNACDKTFRKTALHVAMVQGSVAGVKFLLAKGADVNAFDYQGHTPLFYAITRSNTRKNDYRQCVELLVEHGANLQVVATEEDSLFRRASRCQNYLLIEPLLAHLAIIEAAGKPIRTPILNHIDSDIRLKKHYEFCKQELTKMKAKAVFGTVTLWKFLHDDENKVALYTRKKESFDAIMNANFVSDLYYISLLHKRFKKAMETDKLRTKTSLVLNEAISQLECNHIIVNRIIGYLSYTDLLKFS